MFFGGVLSTQIAFAQEPLRVHVELRGCSELSEPEVRRVLSAELSAYLTDERSAGITRTIIECQGARAVLRVGDPLSRKVVQRTIDLSSSEPQARGRLLALATAELVVASWSELESNPNPKVEPAGPPPPEAAKAAARRVVQQRVQPRTRALPPRSESPPTRAETPPVEAVIPRQPIDPYDERWPDPHNWGIDDASPDRAFRIVAVGSARSFFSESGTLWGGGLRIGEERFKTVGWTLDALAESGQITTSEARFQVDTATLGGGINLYLRSGWFIGRVGTGLRAGFARAQSDDEAANSAFAQWGWPLGFTGFTLRASRNAVLELLGEAGYVVLPVASGAPSLRGGWFSVQVGFGVVP